MRQLCASSEYSQIDFMMVDPVGLLLIPQKGASIPEKLIRRMMLSRTWQRYERGFIPNIESVTCELCQLPCMQKWWEESASSVEGKTLAEMISDAVRPDQKRLRSVVAMTRLMEVLASGLCAKLVSISNATIEDMRVLRTSFPSLMSKFDHIFISGDEGLGKNSQLFMRGVMKKLGVSRPDQCAYFAAAQDMETVVVARSLGIHAIVVHQCLTNACRTSPFLPFQPSEVAEQFLSKLCLQHRSISELSKLSLQTLCPYSISFHILAPPLDERVYVQTLPPFTSISSFSHLVKASTTDDLSSHLVSARDFLCRKGELSGDFRFPSVTHEGLRIFDNFGQLLIANAMNDIRFLPMQSPPPSGLFCFVASRFTAVSPTWKEATPPKDMESSTYVDIPDDLDTTSIGLSILHRFGKVKMNMINKVLDKMMGYLSMDDGIVQVYFDIERPRIDPVAIANVLYLFHLAGRGHEVERSERFLEQVLLHRAYEDGTIYYNLPESFLLHVARLVNKFPDHFGDNGMKSLLQKRLSEHLAALLTDTESTLYAISLAMCMRACLLCDVEGSEHHILMKEARRRLVGLQRQDGSWDCDPYYRYGSNSRSWIGNEGLTTAYALLALDPHLGSQDCRVDKE